MLLQKASQTTMALMLAITVTAGCASAKDPAPTDNVKSVGAGDHADNDNKTLNDNKALNGNSAVNGAGSAASGSAASTDTPPAGSNKPANPPSGAPAAPAASQEKAKKLYRMNSVYSFVPINKETTSGKVVLLTFDDGPKADKTISALLDTLDKHKAKAIFFVNGYRVKTHPELLKKIADRGQTIGNHSWDHIDLKKESAATVKKQIGDVQTIVKKTTGKTPVFFRPPFGSGNDSVKAIVRGNGMLYMTWSDGSLDWDASTKNKPDKVIANVLDQLHPGVNILMHELPWTTEALDALLTKLEAKGYGFIDPAAIDLGLGSPSKATAK